VEVADFPELAGALCATCHAFGERGWCRATSGNFSARAGDRHLLITQSGCEKSSLEAGDLMLCRADGTPLHAAQRPSAETPLHTCLYRLDPGIGAVLHTHSVAATVVSRRAGDELPLTGFEMQKAFAGIASHADALAIPVYDNDQDMHALAARVAADHAAGRFVLPGFLIRGHGLTAWGGDVAAARRHVEGFEFLLECLWQETLAGGA